MEWVLYALLGALLATQVILILMAAERRAMLVEIVGAINSQHKALDSATCTVLRGQTALLAEELRKIGDRAAAGGQARWDELQSIRTLLEDQTRYFIED